MKNDTDEPTRIMSMDLLRHLLRDEPESEELASEPAIPLTQRKTIEMRAATNGTPTSAE